MQKISFKVCHNDFADANVKTLPAGAPQHVGEAWFSAPSRYGAKIRWAQVRFSALSPWLGDLQRLDLLVIPFERLVAAQRNS
jgi:hypothetical protein